MSQYGIHKILSSNNDMNALITNAVQPHIIEKHHFEKSKY